MFFFVNFTILASELLVPSPGTPGENDVSAQAAIALTGIAAVATILSFILSLSLERGAVPALVVPLLGMLLFVHFYSYTEPPGVAVALYLAAALLAFVGDLPAC